MLARPPTPPAQRGRGRGSRLGSAAAGRPDPCARPCRASVSSARRRDAEASTCRLRCAPSTRPAHQGQARASGPGGSSDRFAVHATRSSVQARAAVGAPAVSASAAWTSAVGTALRAAAGRCLRFAARALLPSHRGPAQAPARSVALLPASASRRRLRPPKRGTPAQLHRRRSRRRPLRSPGLPPVGNARACARTAGSWSRSRRPTCAAVRSAHRRRQGQAVRSAHRGQPATGEEQALRRVQLAATPRRTAPPLGGPAAGGSPAPAPPPQLLWRPRSGTRPGSRGQTRALPAPSPSRSESPDPGTGCQPLAPAPPARFHGCPFRRRSRCRPSRRHRSAVPARWLHAARLICRRRMRRRSRPVHRARPRSSARARRLSRRPGRSS